MLNIISNFESIRLDLAEEIQHRPPGTSRPPAAQSKATQQAEEDGGVSDPELELTTRERTEQRLVHIEQQWLEAAVPKGILLILDDTDDNFFHITCHLDANLREKIQNGEFIELKKLLLEDWGVSQSAEQKLEL